MSFLFISFVEEAASSVRRPISRSNYWRTGMAKVAMKTFALLTSEWNIFWSFGYGDQEACGQASDHGAGECVGRISHTKGPGDKARVVSHTNDFTTATAGLEFLEFCTGCKGLRPVHVSRLRRGGGHSNVERPLSLSRAAF